MSEITKTEDPRPKTDAGYMWLLLVILAVFVYFFGLDIPFVGPDEARYAQVAREMLERGDWITPTLGGYPWFEKPPLLYWLEIVSFKAFGISEFSARLGPALFGLGTIVCLYVLGNLQRSKIKDQRSSIEFANWLALIAASTLGIIVFSHGASFDIIITFPVTAALVSFLIFDQRTHANGKPPAAAGGFDYSPLVLFYFFIGIAVLAKGLIGIVFPFAIVGFYYFLSRQRLNRVFLISLVWGTLLATAIASVWYLPMYLLHGNRFIEEFFIQHHFERFASNRYLHPQPFYFYLWVLPLMTLPWLPFFLASIWNFIFHHRATKTTENIENKDTTSPGYTFSPSRLLTFSAAWLLVPLAFFSFSGSKLPGYILPAVPAAVIFTAAFVFELSQRNSKWRNAIMLTAVATFVTVILLLMFALPRYAETDSVETLIETATNRGYQSSRVLTLSTISHNAEFYAAGRLLRDSNGKQRYLDDIGEVINEIAAEDNRPVLVLVPLKYVSQLTSDKKIKTEIIKDNGDLALAAVSVQ